MSHIYDEHETIAGLRAVVAERGEAYVYERQPGIGFVCIYWDRAKGCPSCLVGHVLAQFGFTNPPAFIEGKAIDMALHKHTAPYKDFEDFAGYWLERFTPDAIRLLATAQAEQDSSETWGRALASAEAEYRRLHPEAGGE